MLQKISDGIQGWFAWIVAAIIAAVFGLWGVESYLGNGSNQHEPIVTVNGQKITRAEFGRYYQQLRQQYLSNTRTATVSDAQLSQIKTYALQSLVQQTAQHTFADDKGFAISESAVQQYILTMPAFQVNGVFSPDKFKTFLSLRGQSELGFTKNVQQSLIVEQGNNAIQSSALVLPGEVNTIFKRTHETRHFGYFQIPLKHFLKTVHVTDASVLKYYNDNKDSFDQPEKIKVDYISVSPKQLEDRLVVSNQEANAFFEENRSNFKTPAQWDVLVVSAPTAAKQASVVQSLTALKDKYKGSGVDTFKQLVTAAGMTFDEQALTSLNASAVVQNALTRMKPGQLSGVVESQGMASLYFLKSATPQKRQSFSDVKTKIKQQIKRTRAEKAFTALTDQLSDLTYTNPNTLTKASKTLNLPIQTSSWITREGLLQGPFSSQKLVNLAFSQGIRVEKNNSQMMDLPDGSVIVIRINAYQAAKPSPLADVKDKIRSFLVKNKAESAAGLEAYRIEQALLKGKQPSDIAKQDHVVWLGGVQVERNAPSKDIPRYIVAGVLSIPATSSDPSAHIKSLLLANGDYAVIKLDAAHPSKTVDETSKAYQSLKTAIPDIYGHLDLTLYHQSILAHAKVKYH